MIKINSFDDFVLTSANKSRYIPILGNAAGVIGAYRKIAVNIGIGQTPLFLLDGVLSAKLLVRAKEKLKLNAFIALYRPFDVTLKNRYEAELKRLRRSDRIKKNGSYPDWALEYLHRYEKTNDTFIKEQMFGIVEPYFIFEKAKNEYVEAIKIFPVDVTTGEEITSDLNDYLFNRAKTMFPIGIESVLISNKKQSAIPKHRFFVDGLENKPAPDGVRRFMFEARQLSFCGTSDANIDDVISHLYNFIDGRIKQNGVAKLADTINHCADIGLYKSNITLYALGAACRKLNNKTIFYDGVTYWRYSETQDISSWILRVYEIIQPRLIKGKLTIIERKESDAAFFYDNTSLKERLKHIFNLKPVKDKRFDTHGMAIVWAIKWIVDNLRYPIAFLDNTLHRLFMERELYGEKLRFYDEYFSEEHCAWLKKQLPHADSLARQKIMETVGFDPDVEKHSMSNLPKGHYAPVHYSVEMYLEKIQKEVILL